MGYLTEIYGLEFTHSPARMGMIKLFDFGTQSRFTACAVIEPTFEKMLTNQEP